MKVDGASLRERMRSRTVGDLRSVLEHRADYTPAAVAAAEEELALRSTAGVPEDPPAVDGVAADADRSLRARLPVGLWLVFWLATVTSVGFVLAVVILAVIFLANGITLREFGRPLWQEFAIAALAFWIAVAIRAERSYVRVLLLSFTGAVAAYHVAGIVATRELTMDALNGAGILIVAVWYFGFSEDVVSYYRGLREVSS